ncbi:poly(A) polymerase-like isoform X1 [Crassostrea angulata]|uniref:poly(A) polymerase-like isoform X1 n=1 Tax=Magallana angulata TaxID=2784310 RepID=UPI0022B1FBFF|nr:poly(A) polymerase-like isoform X1 [Crassostrea angulata]
MLTDTISTATTREQDLTSTAYTTPSTNKQTTRSEAYTTSVTSIQTTIISTATTGGQDMTSTAYTTTSTNEQTTRSEASLTDVSQTTTISATTGGQDMTSTAYTTTSINEQTIRSEAYTTSAMCPCQCEYFDKIVYWAQENNQLKQYEELTKKLAEIKDILKMETKNLSSFVNKKISAADDRPSAVATGYLGAVIIIIVLTGIVLLDLPVIIQHARLLFWDIQRLCARG